MMRTRNFRVQNDVVERGQSPRVKKETKPTERKVGECFQWKAHGQCSKGDSCSFSHDTQNSGNRGQGQRRKGRSSSPASHSKAKKKQTDGEGQKSSQKSRNKQENSLVTSEIPCRFKFCKNPSCKFWHPSVCQNYKSEKGCVYGDTCHFRHIEAEGNPAKSRRKEVRKDQLRCWRSLYNWVVYFKILIRDSPFHCNLGIEKRRQILQWHLERKGPSRGIIQKCAPHERSPCAPKFEERSHGRPWSKNDTPAKQRGTWRKYLQAQEFGHTYFLYSNWKMDAGTYFNKTRGARIRSWFRTIGAHDEQKRITLRRDGPTVVFTVNGEVHTHEEAQVFVHDLNQFVTVQLLEETLAVPSLGKLCEDRGYSYEWVCGQKPRLTPKWEEYHLQDGQFRTSCRSRLILGFLEAVRPLNCYHRTRWEGKQNKPLETELLQVHLQVQCLSEVTKWYPETRVIPKKHKTVIKKGDDRRNSDDPLADLLEWLTEFQENLVKELPGIAHSSRESDLEHLVEVATTSRKHCIFLNALANFFLAQKSLVTWWRRISKSSMRGMNPETITGTLLW